MFLRNSDWCYGLAAVGEGFLPASLVSAIHYHERLNNPQGIVFELDDDIAGICWGTCYDSIRKNAALAEFLAKARKKGGYYLRFREQKKRNPAGRWTKTRSRRKNKKKR